MKKSASGSVCKYCGNWFEQNDGPGKNSLYCSAKCRNAQHYLARKQKINPDKVMAAAGNRYCKICGTLLKPNQAVYCSDDCRLYISKKNKKSLSWDAILKGMEETGLSYGYYVGRYDNVGTD